MKRGFPFTYQNSRAFTLIELLVVISVIGILAAFAIASLSGAQSRGRDAQRKNDLDQMKKALQMYYNDNGYFPSLDCWQTQSCWINGLSLTPDYIKSIPNDPKEQNTGACNNVADQTDACHLYHYCSDASWNGQKYVLSNNLESGPTNYSSLGICESMSGGHIYYVYSP